MKKHGFIRFIFIAVKRFFCRKHHHPHRPKVSILIPFSSKDKVRIETFKWLLKYWKHELPDAEIIIGKSHSKVFCKAEAFNDAAKRATGKVFVILDADAYLYGKIITKCADRILEELKHGNHLWYVPYRHLYRLKRNITKLILESDPENPLRLPSPLPPEYIKGNTQAHMYGHRFAAMIMIFPREAYELLGCFDERFKGWGGEDSCLMRALDTLWGRHKTARNEIYHLWHPFIGDNVLNRKWEGQEEVNVNHKLSSRYNKANGHPKMMRQLMDESLEYKNDQER